MPTPSIACNLILQNFLHMAKDFLISGFRRLSKMEKISENLNFAITFKEIVLFIFACSCLKYF